MVPYYRQSRIDCLSLFPHKRTKWLMNTKSNNFFLLKRIILSSNLNASSPQTSHVYIIACDFHKGVHSLCGPFRFILTCRSESNELGRPGFGYGVTVQICSTFSVTLFFPLCWTDLEWTTLLLFSLSLIHKLAAAFLGWTNTK